MNIFPTQPFSPTPTIFGPPFSSFLIIPSKGSNGPKNRVRCAIALAASSVASDRSDAILRAASDTDGINDATIVSSADVGCDARGIGVGMEGPGLYPVSEEVRGGGVVVRAVITTCVPMSSAASAMMDVKLRSLRKFIITLCRFPLSFPHTLQLEMTRLLGELAHPTRLLQQFLQ